MSEYDLSYFFLGEDAEDPEGSYVITAPSEQIDRQLFAQYPDQDAISRSALMVCFDEKQNRAINQMWINVRCFDIEDVPMGVWMALLAALLVIVSVGFRKSRRR